MENWFLLQFKPNAHRLAERNLQRQGFNTFLPMQEVTKRKETRFVNNLRPLFPGYMFVSFELATAPWRKINNTIGVSRLVSFNAPPKALPAELMSGLMQRCNADGKLLAPKQLREGDKIEVLTGPFANFIATIETIDAEKRVWALMDLMGQKTRIQVTSEQVQLTN